jgi:hypothetical protein
MSIVAYTEAAHMPLVPPHGTEMLSGFSRTESSLHIANWLDAISAEIYETDPDQLRLVLPLDGVIIPLAHLKARMPDYPLADVEIQFIGKDDTVPVTDQRQHPHRLSPVINQGNPTKVIIPEDIADTLWVWRESNRLIRETGFEGQILMYPVSRKPSTDPCMYEGFKDCAVFPPLKNGEDPWVNSWAGMDSGRFSYRTNRERGLDIAILERMAAFPLIGEPSNPAQYKRFLEQNSIVSRPGDSHIYTLLMQLGARQTTEKFAFARDVIPLFLAER